MVHESLLPNDHHVPASREPREVQFAMQICDAFNFFVVWFLSHDDLCVRNKRPCLTYDCDGDSSVLLIARYLSLGVFL